MHMDNPIYLALDFPDYQTAHQFLVKNDLHEVPVKVGMELFYREGPDIIKKLRDQGHDIFLDLKCHDIPTTIYKTMRNIAQLDIQMINVHALGSSEMIRRAKEGLIEGAKAEVPHLIAVTILTSMNDTVLKHELKINEKVAETVLHLATLSKGAGADGVVCSAHEVPVIKSALGSEFLTVTPGIRLAESDHNDQLRVATPGLAKTNGSDYIVIGRSITESIDPKNSYLKALEEWNFVNRS